MPSSNISNGKRHSPNLPYSKGLLLLMIRGAVADSETPMVIVTLQMLALQKFVFCIQFNKMKVLDSNGVVD